MRGGRGEGGGGVRREGGNWGGGGYGGGRKCKERGEGYVRVGTASLSVATHCPTTLLLFSAVCPSVFFAFSLFFGVADHCL